jgi:DNA-binding NtrC family response regulator
LCKVILVGADIALLEGLAQTLLGCGHEVTFAATLTEAAGIMTGEEAAIVAVSTEALEDAGHGATLPLTANSALIVYGKSHGEHVFLPPKLQRATLAHLVLPLERQRLLALVKSFDSRSRTTGRTHREIAGEDLQLEF